MFTIVVIYAVANSGGSDVPQPVVKPLTAEQKAAKDHAASKVTAAHACRNLVKQTMHDPESSQWESPWYTDATNNGSVWEVQITGRAKNKFGALVRGTFQCKMNRTGDDWRAIEVRPL